MINYGKQSISKDDIKELVKALKSDFLTQGPAIEIFEKKLSKYCGSKYALAFNNGTSALHIANLVLGTKKSKTVATTPITFLATANSVIYCGGKVEFVDINDKNFNIDLVSLEDKLKNKNIFGIIIVHLGGELADIESIRVLAKKYNAWIIEDACHAIGGKWIDSKNTKRIVGDCSYSEITTFSFHPVKHITTGEGGAILTNDKSIYENAKLLRSHGMFKEDKWFKKKPWYYEMRQLGYNYRITDFQAALGSSQLQKSDKWVKIRSDKVKYYDKKLQKVKQVIPQEHNFKFINSYHLYIILAKNRDKLFLFLKENGVNCQIHYIPIYRQPFYKGLNFNNFPNSEQYYQNGISLPLYPSLKKKEQDKIIKLIKDFYRD
jgi:UDP-4-amino-4,6-dideoxy-N-acetyl-beta-L-altrosamine transaminase